MKVVAILILALVWVFGFEGSYLAQAAEVCSSKLGSAATAPDSIAEDMLPFIRNGAVIVDAKPSLNDAEVEAARDILNSDKNSKLLHNTNHYFYTTSLDEIGSIFGLGIQTKLTNYVSDMTAKINRALVANGEVRVKPNLMLLRSELGSFFKGHRHADSYASLTVAFEAHGSYAYTFSGETLLADAQQTMIMTDGDRATVLGREATYHGTRGFHGSRLLFVVLFVRE